MRYICCDNGGEKVKIKDKLVTENIKGIDIEFTSPSTPQQNGIVERGFQSIYNKVRSMCNGAHLDNDLKKANLQIRKMPFSLKKIKFLIALFLPKNFVKRFIQF